MKFGIFHELATPRLDAPALELPGCVFVQALSEVESSSMSELLPPVIGFSIGQVPESEWAGFHVAQPRTECRSGLRPRGLLVSSVIDHEQARGELARRFGFRAQD